MFCCSRWLTWCCCCVCAVIGKGGEQIASIQSESECKIQFAPGIYSSHHCFVFCCLSVEYSLNIYWIFSEYSQCWLNECSLICDWMKCNYLAVTCDTWQIWEHCVYSIYKLFNVCGRTVVRLMSRLVWWHAAHRSMSLHTSTTFRRFLKTLFSVHSTLTMFLVY